LRAFARVVARVRARLVLVSLATVLRRAPRAFAVRPRVVRVGVARRAERAALAGFALCFRACISSASSSRRAAFISSSTRWEHVVLFLAHVMVHAALQLVHLRLQVVVPPDPVPDHRHVPLHGRMLVERLGEHLVQPVVVERAHARIEDLLLDQRVHLELAADLIGRLAALALRHVAGDPLDDPGEAATAVEAPEQLRDLLVILLQELDGVHESSSSDAYPSRPIAQSPSRRRAARGCARAGGRSRPDRRR
jgi:hypothetical protein